MKEQLSLLDDLSQYRNAEEMSTYYKFIIAHAKKDSAVLRLLRLKKGRFKEFCEEFTPAYIFSMSTFFPKDAQLKVVLGNQGYDFLMKRFDGVVEKFEVSSYINGQEDTKISQKLNEVGRWQSRLSSLESLEEKRNIFLEKTKKNIIKKSQKNYDNVTLIFSTTIFTLKHFPENHEYLLQEKIIEYIKETTFHAKGVYLITDNGDAIEHSAAHMLRIK
ncbi:hypothetical protein [Exiguobacterium sp. 17-1]|uniref:hypothetical protein n=1 Tax=Exiguobacterium sp. 17-1 TaxID=2931981 RepID=UPI001FFF1383|nr:hypothetical protein [Exiguobacterium sp. 17-1]MCK2157718.1 hypothetical protein [Exiguobacterium sp. 17-1]